MEKPNVTLEAMAGTLKVNGQKNMSIKKKKRSFDKRRDKQEKWHETAGCKRFFFVNKSNSFLKSSYRVEC